MSKRSSRRTFTSRRRTRRADLVHLDPYTGGCTDVDRDLALDIILNPSAYYVNVHNAEFPAERCEDNSTALD